MADFLARRLRSQNSTNGATSLDALELEKTSFKRLLAGISHEDLDEFSVFIREELISQQTKINAKRKVKSEEGIVELNDVDIILPSNSNANQFLSQFMSRITWLIILLLLQSVSGTILSNYEALLANNMIVTYFLTLLIGTGGNAGSQSSNVSLSLLGTLTAASGSQNWKENKSNLPKIIANLVREMILSSLFGVFLGLTAFLRVLWTFPTDTYAALAVSLSTFVVVLTSVAIGSATPFLLSWFRFNPNFGSGPVITSVVDIIAIVETCAICAYILPST